MAPSWRVDCEKIFQECGCYWWIGGGRHRFPTDLCLCGWDASEGVIAALGFYGKRLRIGYGSLGGWDSFGPERLITRSKGNVLYELDGQSALDLYKKYLDDNNAGSGRGTAISASVAHRG